MSCHEIVKKVPYIRFNIQSLQVFDFVRKVIPFSNFLCKIAFILKSYQNLLRVIFRVALFRKLSVV